MTLTSGGHQQVMIKCDQEQSMKRIAELLQERRRSRRTSGIIRQWSGGKRALPSERVVAHHDLMEKTSVIVNVTSLLAPWLVRHCAWSLTRFAIGAEGQTAFKRRRGKNDAGETACFSEAICYRNPLQIPPTWNHDGGQMACCWESWTCLMWVPSEALRRHGHSADQQ